MFQSGSECSFEVQNVFCVISDVTISTTSSIRSSERSSLPSWRYFVPHGASIEPTQRNQNMERMKVVSIDGFCSSPPFCSYLKLSAFRNIEFANV